MDSSVDREFLLNYLFSFLKNMSRTSRTSTGTSLRSQVKGEKGGAVRIVNIVSKSGNTQDTTDDGTYLLWLFR